MNIQITHKSISPSNPAKVALIVKNDDTVLLTDQVDLSRKNKREDFIKDLVKNCPGIDADDLNEKLLSIAHNLLTKPEEPKEKTDEPTETPLMLSETALNETDRDMVNAARDFLKNPRLVDYIIGHIEHLGVVGERSLSLALYLIYSSRLLVKPLAGIVLGTSSSGKSFAISTVAKLFPPEAIFQAHRLTPAALQYLQSGSLVHRAVISGERSRNVEDEAAETTRSLREMISDGILRIAVCGKGEDGNLTTYHIEQPGPISYVESTTLGSGEIFDEDKTRFLFLCCDESEGQSRAILERLATDAAEPKHNEEIESMVALHHTVQRLLQAQDVVIPFARELVEVIPCRRPESRRAFGHLLALIKAVALLHQYQRETDGYGRIVAEAIDYNFVREYLSEAIGRGLGVVLSAGAESLLEVIEEHYRVGDKFIVNDLKEKTGLGKVVYDRVRELRQHGYIRLSVPGAGSVAAKYELNPIPDGASGLELPPLNKQACNSSTGKAETNV